VVTFCQIGIGPFACPSFGPDSNLTVLWRSVVEDTDFIRTPFYGRPWQLNTVLAATPFFTFSFFFFGFSSRLHQHWCLCTSGENGPEIRHHIQGQGNTKTKP
jgi:hypothetical protein